MASVEPRASDYRVVWRQDGAKQFERFPTDRQADKFRKLVEAHGNRWPSGWIKGHGFTDQLPDAPTFTDWAARAIKSRSRANARTRHDYQRDIDRHLTGPFGALQVNEISREHVGKWLIEISQTISAKTVKNVHGLASSIMADAVTAGHTTTNPFRGAVAALPTVRHEEMVFLSRGEFDTLLARVSADYALLVQTLAMTGLRWSEATALRVRDLDVLGKRIGVSRAWKRTPESYFVIGEPKSVRSRRTITIPDSLARALIPLTTRDGEEFLFLSPMGRPVRHANFRQRAWLPAIRATQRCDTHRDAVKPCGCAGTLTKTPRIHDLRHSHASWLIAARVPLPAIQRRLGHESITTTIDRYGHLAPELDAEITAALDGIPAAALELDPVDR